MTTRCQTADSTIFLLPVKTLVACDFELPHQRLVEHRPDRQIEARLLATPSMTEEGAKVPVLIPTSVRPRLVRRR